MESKLIEGGAQDAKLINLLPLLSHDLLKYSMIQLPDESIKSPVRQQRLGDVENAVVSDKQIAVEEGHQIADL